MEYDYVDYRVEDNLPDVVINWNGVPEESGETIEEQTQEQCHYVDYHKLILCVLALVSVAILGVFLYILPIFKPSQTCQCAISDVFPKEDITLGIIDTSTVVSCDSNGAKDCKSICTSLGKNLTVPTHGKALCKIDENQKKYQGTLYYRPCVEVLWLPTHLNVEVCCLNGDACYC